jgi:hypothetical protein
MTLVLFGWMSTQPYFKDVTNMDIKKDIYKEQIEKIEEEMLPFGFVEDGVDDEISTTAFEDGAVWHKENAEKFWEDRMNHGAGGWY